MFKKQVIISIPIDIDMHFFTSINLGFLKILKNNNLKCSFLKPISRIENYYFNHTNDILNMHNFPNIKSINPIKINDISLLKKNIEYNNIIDNIIQKTYQNIYNTDILFIEGIIPVCIKELIFQLNCDIANIFNAKIIFVTSMSIINKNLEKIESKIKILFKNKLNDFNIKNTYLFIKKKYAYQNINPFFYNLNIFQHFLYTKKYNFVSKKFLFSKNKNIILVPWLKNFIFGINVKLICNYLNCNIINNIKYKKIKYIIYFDKKIFINLQKFSESLLVISFKNKKIIKIIDQILSKKIIFNAILFTDFIINKKFYKINIIKKIVKNNISLFCVKDNLYNIFLKLENIYKYDFPINDTDLITNIINYTKLYIPSNFFKQKDLNYKFYVSPFIFKYNLINKASKSKKIILLPEGKELRVLKAASICSEKNIANCILFGKTKEIINIAKKNNININNNNISIIDPDLIRNNYIEKLMYIRKNKLLSKYEAIHLLNDNMFLATMMLKEHKVDGIVSGANTTTANTIRPALQIIKTLSKYSIVSSIFIMLLPKNVLIYADCAINPNPDYKQLAEIAIQSVETSKLFNFQPKVAMISYSTGTSAKGIEVEKVYKATNLVRKKIPNLLIDGPLQYDTAIMRNVAKYKAPNSLVAGKANIIIFPDLNTGNTTYKAVQRSSNIISIGPILQGIKQPINDLSRGASIEDIIYTIAVTVIQATK
ncbi:phosphate acetyltransferase [Enterobacteriaceae endosymbiont of Donacia cincticornis]|uniref:phosphate acetyltransferase n=1 Tax=Enterobacteriaceae endosymbiont of Donacia cincticornis TaxID=2675773 RepID=UPI0014495A3B|nr:phosphate acetyltransferase [Enterobacteriaceae endosymbiont of Donacia cincticornis]QJC35968.1 phosphate acetyltransferase [Enterobacteriaceae endosymbiont of Donacia cincticornis]